MISRQWRGVARESSAEAYVEHLRDQTLPALEKLPGFAGACVLRRRIPAGVEFLVVTRWESLEAIRGFAGEDAEAAVVPQVVQEMMVEYERRARHYEVVPSK